MISLDRNYQEVVNLSFVLLGLYLTLNERAHFSRIMTSVDRRIFKILSALFPEREKVHN